MTFLKSRSLVILVVGFALLALVGGSVPFLLAAQEDDQVLVRHTLEVKNRLSRIAIALLDANNNQRGYAIIGDEAAVSRFGQLSRQAMAEIESLSAEIADNPEQKARVERLRADASNFIEQLQGYIDQQRAGRLEAVMAEFRRGAVRNALGELRGLLNQMDAAETALLGPRSALAQNSAETVQLFIYGLLALIFGLTVVVVVDTRRRFHALEIATADLNRSIGQERALQAQLQQSQKMEAIGQLAGGIAHDFNNMLAVVLSSLALYKRRAARGEADLSGFIDGAIDGANRAARLTHRLLAYSRQQPLNPRSIDANRLIADMSELLGRSIGEQYRLETVLAGGLWRTLADPGQLENAIVNLSINARDAMKNGGKVTIETANAFLDEAYAESHDVQSGQYVLIAISDEGIGMSPEVIEKAFDPFFTTKGVGQGTGLGLSQVQGFVKQSGGHIKIYSEPGHGTTVKIYLPRHHGEAQDAPVAPAVIGEALRGGTEEVILVLEDDPRVRSVVVESLRELGYTVLHASHGEQALALLDKHGERIVLLFTDVIMPDVNGRRVAEQARLKFPNLRIIFTTGFSRNAIIHNGVLDAGVNFIAKPFTLEALAQKVRSVLDGQS